MANESEDNKNINTPLTITTNPIFQSPTETITSMNSIHQPLHIKLTPLNYLIWKNQFELALNFTRLHSFIDPSAQPSVKFSAPTAAGAPSVSNLEYETWWKKDHFLCNWIISSLSDQVIPYTIRLTSSAEIWDSLLLAYGAPTQAHIIQMTICGSRASAKTPCPWRLPLPAQAHG